MLNNKEGIGVPEVYASATWKCLEHDERLKTAQEFLGEQGRNLYCRQASSRFGLLGSTINYDRNGFLARNKPIDGALQKAIPTNTPIISLVLFEIGRTPRWKTYARLNATQVLLPIHGEWCLYDWERLLRMHPKYAVRNSRKASTTIPRRCHWNWLHWKSWDHSRRG